MIAKFFTKMIIRIIRIYQICLSPYLSANCRYWPTCSQYAIIALNKYGIIRGLLLATKRIFRCHPFGNSGHDPVP